MSLYLLNSKLCEAVKCGQSINDLGMLLKDLIRLRSWNVNSGISVENLQSRDERLIFYTMIDDKLKVDHSDKLECYDCSFEKDIDDRSCVCKRCHEDCSIGRCQECYGAFCRLCKVQRHKLCIKCYHDNKIC
jgi:hypothetical protein